MCPSPSQPPSPEVTIILIFIPGLERHINEYCVYSFGFFCSTPCLQGLPMMLYVTLVHSFFTVCCTTFIYSCSCQWAFGFPVGVYEHSYMCLVVDVPSRGKVDINRLEKLLNFFLWWLHQHSHQRWVLESPPPLQHLAVPVFLVSGFFLVGDCGISFPF